MDAHPRTPLDEPAAAPLWLVERVRLLRELGFFQQSPEASAEAFAAAWARRHVLKWGREPDATDPHLTVDLIASDPTRTVYMDVECDPFPGEGAYVRWVEGLCRITRGRVDLLRVEERWLRDPTEFYQEADAEEEKPFRPVEVTLTTRRRRLVIYPRWHGDYIAVSDLVEAVDALMGPLGPRLYFMDQDSQSALVLALTASEGRRLESGLGLRIVRGRDQPHPLHWLERLRSAWRAATWKPPRP
ncbi:MAG TPA: hypothetical protein VNZ52_13305 [Candidatus Thermoplasmatota archaeon]|nr:hypothetical protein [Candidatus Thermoplasmatota archaeon]